MIVDTVEKRQRINYRANYIAIDDVKACLQAGGFQIAAEERLPNGTGTKISVGNGAIVNVYDTGKVVVQGKNQDPMKECLGVQPAAVAVAGLDERRIADLLGQKTLSMARHYSRSANLATKNRETIATLETENARRARSVKPSAKSVKPKPKEKSE
ncbi:hypothetical protein [Fuscibacter oryzae]|uniref:Uncharacterized protein n=1 Tax=Fuscibacter oryzae TaxID=2803939 RepID=A0A8J7STS0_9RHOB|nr:hypothetical protein [Fuscibacter oryzae]MBL4927767.1 hypothetical protein [Fuscibacter oryzae]